MRRTDPSTILDRIVQRKFAEIIERSERLPLSELQRQARQARRVLLG